MVVREKEKNEFNEGKLSFTKMLAVIKIMLLSYHKIPG